LGRRLNRKRERRQQRRRTARAVQFVRELFSSGPAAEWEVDPPDGLEGGLGVREPRRPLHPSMSGAVSLEAPSEERRDVWAVGEKERD